MLDKMPIPALLLITAISIVGLLAVFTGDGGVTRMTTLSGIYAVDSPSGKAVTCFVERNSGAMDCVPHNHMNTE